LNFDIGYVSKQLAGIGAAPEDLNRPRNWDSGLWMLTQCLQGSASLAAP